MNNAKMVAYAKKIIKELQTLKIGRVALENTGNIGKSYRKHDEIGTPICITVDFESLDDKSVTLRDRDSMEQSRVLSNNLNEIISSKIKL